MIRETFKTHEEAKSRLAEVVLKGADFASEYVTDKGYVVAYAWTEEDASFSGQVFNRWRDGNDTFCVVTLRGNVVDFRRNGREVPARCQHLTRHMAQEFGRRFA